jgi:hypothetical protein
MHASRLCISWTCPRVSSPVSMRSRREPVPTKKQFVPFRVYGPGFPASTQITRSLNDSHGGCAGSLLATLNLSRPSATTFRDESGEPSLQRCTRMVEIARPSPVDRGREDVGEATQQQQTASVMRWSAHKPVARARVTNFPGLLGTKSPFRGLACSPAGVGRRAVQAGVHGTIVHDVRGSRCVLARDGVEQQFSLDPCRCRSP